MAKKKDMVTIICYRKEETMSRSAAIEEFMDCVNNSEGHERNRYVNILMDLLDGKTICSDRDGDY